MRFDYDVIEQITGVSPEAYIDHMEQQVLCDSLIEYFTLEDYVQNYKVNLLP